MSGLREASLPAYRDCRENLPAMSRDVLAKIVLLDQTVDTTIDLDITLPELLWPTLASSDVYIPR